MKVYELWGKLKNSKEPIAGLKAVLIARTKETLTKEYPVYLENITTTSKKTSSKKKTTGVYSIAEDY